MGKGEDAFIAKIRIKSKIQGTFSTAAAFFE